MIGVDVTGFETLMTAVAALLFVRNVALRRTLARIAAEATDRGPESESRGGRSRGPRRAADAVTALRLRLRAAEEEASLRGTTAAPLAPTHDLSGLLREAAVRAGAVVGAEWRAAASAAPDGSVTECVAPPLLLASLRGVLARRPLGPDGALSEDEWADDRPANPLWHTHGVRRSLVRRVPRPDGGTVVLWWGFSAPGRPTAADRASATALARELADKLGVAAALGRLRDDRDEQAAASRRKTDFLACLSHDIRSPLQSAASALRLVGTEGEDGELVDLCLRNIARVGELADDLVDYSRHKGGVLVAAPRTFDLAADVREWAGALAPVAAAARLGLAFETDHDEVPALADRTHVGRVVTNLVQNALRYTREGTVTVRVLRGDGSRASVEVHDTGPGMTPEETARLFVPFERLGRTGGGGAGIGLYVCRTLAELSGGELSVDSAPGRGTTFTLSLPAAERKPGPPSVAPSPPGPAADARARPSESGRKFGPGSASDAGTEFSSRLSVLVVDDDPDVAHTTARCLLREGFDARPATSVEDAVRSFAESPADAVVTDVNMPGGGGDAVARRVRGMKPDVAVLFVGGDVSGNGVDRLSKPASPDVIASAVRSLLPAGPSSTSPAPGS